MISTLLAAAATSLLLFQGAQLPAPPHTLVRVFLDCDECDENYLKKEVTFIDYVRNREDADVHVLVTTQMTGGGGRQFTLKFIGLHAYEHQDQTLTYNAPQTATSDERRAGFAEVFRLGLVRYAAQSSIAERLRVTFKEGTAAAKLSGKQADNWNYWVFRINGGGNFNGEESSTGRSVRASVNANRTTDAWRMSFSASSNYRDSTFVLDEDETILSVTRSTNVSGIVVKSLSDHWSFGLSENTESSTFRNYALNLRVAPGIEYDVFPYSESTRRMLTFQYTVGADLHRYREVTIFEKTEEKLADHRAEVGLSLRQPWGTAFAATNFSQYLTDPSKYSLGVVGETNIRIFKGLSFNMFGEFERTRDQIYLPKGEASTEEILLRQRQLFTGYQYYFNFGISYSFGSIFNNIVNPRFGGAGGFDF
jgi:hypothetical protein